MRLIQPINFIAPHFLFKIFYWAFANDDLAIWVAADCTGLGVPGAFMSMIGISLLNEIVMVKDIHDSAEILYRRAILLKLLL